MGVLTGALQSGAKKISREKELTRRHDALFEARRAN